KPETQPEAEPLVQPIRKRMQQRGRLPAGQVCRSSFVLGWRAEIDRVQPAPAAWFDCHQKRKPQPRGMVGLGPPFRSVTRREAWADLYALWFQMCAAAN